MRRVFFDILLFISVFVFPWWITAILALVGIFSFEDFYEFVAVFIIMYSLFSVPSNLWISSPYALVFVAFIYIGVQHLRSNMIMYKK